MNDLPHDWHWTTVGEIAADLQYGYTASASDQPCGPRFLRISDIQDGQVDWTTVPYCSIDPVDIPKYALRSGDILFARTGGTVGKSFIIDSLPAEAVFASYLIRVSPRPHIYPKFLYYFFQSLAYWEQIGLKKGGLQGNVNATTLSSLHVPLCSRGDQVRIVAKIEELFSELDNGVESLNIARRQLRAYRLATLNAATSGQLLVKRGLRDAPFSMAEETMLGSVVERLDQGWSPRCLNHPSLSDDVWCVMKTTAVQPATFREEENKELPASLEPRPHLSIRKGDVLVTRAGPRNRVGVACLVRSSRPRLMLCDKAYRIRANHEKIVPEYLEIILNAPRTIDRIETLKTGISDSGVNLTQQRFLSLDISVPSIAEQEITIAEVQSVLSNVSHTQTQVDDALAREALLRQAILERAFEGRLVAHDPRDEPASVLLERIASENGQAAQQNGARRAGRRRRTGT